MVTAQEVAAPLANYCVPVPAQAPGVCRICHGCPNPGYPTCWSCSEVVSQIAYPCKTVIPVSLYRIPSQLHTMLKYYKSQRHPHRNDFSVALIAVLASFLRIHGPCIEQAGGSPWDIITTVPSSRIRPGEHPLTVALRKVPSLWSRHETLLLRGPGDLDHLVAADDGYTATRSLDGERVLLLDDTYTSGSRS